MARPKDDEQRKIGSKGRAIVHFQLDAEHWDYKEETGNDYGRDCIIELSEDNEWRNHKIEGQIKGTAQPRITVDNEISIPVPVKTVEYALGSPIAFILFVANTKTNDVYYQCLQHFFIEHKEYFEKLDQKTINIRIPTTQNLESNDELLQLWAKTIYVDGPSRTLHEYTYSLV